MFDVGFWELTLIATLALLVLGPDKLPGVVNGVGRMLGRARSLARGLKMQIEREMNQSATVTPKPKPRQGSAKPSTAKAGQPGAAGSATRPEAGDVSSPGEPLQDISRPEPDELHGESRPAE